MRPRKHLSTAQTMGGNIKRLRLLKELKIKELAKAMHVAVQSWYKWERGEVIPEDENQLKIAALLQVGVDDIRRGIGAAPVFLADDGREEVKPAPDSREAEGSAHIPVIGLATCGISGWYNPMPLAVRAPPPVDYENPESLFAVLAAGEDMEPDGIRAGYLLYCDALVKPEPGDAVYVRTRDGNAAIKRFLKHDGHWVMFQGWFDPDQSGDQRPCISKYDSDFVEYVASVVVVRRKA